MAIHQLAKKHLSFTALRTAFSKHLLSLSDMRQESKCQHSLHDAVMSAFACMYFQDPSLAEFQRRMEEEQQLNNMRTLFNVTRIPRDSQLRGIIDAVPSEQLGPIFAHIYEQLRRHKHLESYKLFSKYLLCAIDGTQYHSSKQIHCSHCLHKHHSNGDITYSHGILQGAIMHPDKKQVIPLMPEAIQNSDGQKKQDCESNAAKRFVAQLKDTHPRQLFLIVGDGLMSHQPMIENVIAQGMDYLFVAKPGDHRRLYDWLDSYPQLPSLEEKDDQGRTHCYRWKNQVPLNGNPNALEVNWLEYRLINAEGKETYRNSWVTSLDVNTDTIIDLVRAGRCRWKIENECFNTLKNQGYHIEHNYGHGQQHLSLNMYLLTLLAFLFHQVSELTDGLYQACRKKAVSKRYLWERLRGIINLLVVPTWETLLDMYLNPDDYAITAEKIG
ncbi:MAG: transposase [Chloroflexi bacterium]|nr:transposase [Chloroflexota bacterium]